MLCTVQCKNRVLNVTFFSSISDLRRVNRVDHGISRSQYQSSFDAVLKALIVFASLDQTCHVLCNLSESSESVTPCGVITRRDFEYAQPNTLYWEGAFQLVCPQCFQQTHPVRKMPTMHRYSPSPISPVRQGNRSAGGRTILFTSSECV